MRANTTGRRWPALFRLAVAALAVALPAAAQTAIHLSTQSRNVDFSAAAATKVFKSGVVLPAACEAGESFFRTDAVPGQNLYVCAAANTWTLSGAGTLTQGGAGLVCETVDATTTCRTDTAVVPYYLSGTGAPSAACQAGRDFYTDTAAGRLYVCTAVDTWRAVSEPFLDTSVVHESDEFLPSAAIGKLNWHSGSVGAGCTVAAQAPAAGHPGVYRLTTAATSGDGCYLTLDGAGTAAIWAGLSAASNWEMRWIFHPADPTAALLRIGMAAAGSGSTAAPATGAWARYQDGVDTDLMFEVCDASTCASVSSGVTVSASNWYALRLRSLAAGQWLFSVSTNGGAWSAEKSACASGGGCDVSVTLPSAGQSPLAQWLAGDAAAHSLDIDFWAWKSRENAR